MSARRKRVISTQEIQFKHKPAKMLLTEKKKGVSQNGQTPSIIGICSDCVLDRPVFERCQTLLHPELTPWWTFLLADGAHHKKPHSPTHPRYYQKMSWNLICWYIWTTFRIIISWSWSIDFPNFDALSIYRSRSNLGLLDIHARTHGRNGLEVSVQMYPDSVQN